MPFAPWPSGSSLSRAICHYLQYITIKLSLLLRKKRTLQHWLRKHKTKKKARKKNWDSEERDAFNCIKISAPGHILIYPGNFREKFIINTDGSECGKGAGIEMQTPALKQWKHCFKKKRIKENFVRCWKASQAYKVETELKDKLKIQWASEPTK